MTASTCSSSGSRSAARCSCKRFHDRRHDPLKVWKISPIDLEAHQANADDYTEARATACWRRPTESDAPWT